MCPWNRVESRPKVKAQKKSDRNSSDSSKNPLVVTNQPRHSYGGNSKERASVGGGGGYIQRVTNDDREDEMNENLGSVKEYIIAILLCIS